MRFIDEAVIIIRSGRGGDGRVSFRREKFVPRGGPDGGDGGRGGDVVFVADPGMKTLLDYHHKRNYRAEDGAKGGTSRKTGKGGEALVLRVPVGTVVYDEASGEALADLVQPWQREVVAEGGKGGLGNQHFALPWRQAPDFAIPGTDGVEYTTRLELKLLADIGIVGLPNAGKSTLINRISAAKAKVADYPFTTLIPNLGVVQVGDQSFVVADMPGLIEGAAQGVGLGLQFLRHCERTRALLHLVDASEGHDAVHAFEVVEAELAAHGAGLEKKPLVLAANKTDLPGCEANVEALEALARARGVPFFALSGLAGLGLKDLIATLATLALAPQD